MTWLYKFKVICKALLQGQLILLFTKIWLNRNKRLQQLSRLGKPVKPANFSTLIDSIEPIILLIDHYLGGGANFYRDQKIAKLLADNKVIILLLNDPLSSTFLLCYIHPEKPRFYTKIHDFEGCIEALSQANIAEILLNNCVSYANAATLPLALIQLKAKKNIKLSLFLHDYFAICPSYNLLNAQGHFCGIPSELQTCHNCLNQHKGHFTQLLPHCSIDSWRANWQLFLQAADTIHCFSLNSSELLLKAYPQLAKEKIKVEPHQVDYIRYRPQIKQQAHLHIAVVGNINRPEKGRDLILEMIKLIETRKLAVKITIIGNLAQAPKSSILTVTGAYQRDELGKILEASSANLCFFPSIWPETFSYICEELMAMGVYLAALNIGAPAERIKHYSRGLLIESFTAEAVLKELLDFNKTFASRTASILLAPS